MKSELPIWAAGLCVGGLVVFELVLFEGSSPTDWLWDFLNAYYLAGQAALNNDPSALRDLIGKGATGFVNIPIVAYWFSPFALLPPQPAAWVFTALGLASVVAAWFLLVRLAGLELRERWLLAVLFLVNGSLLNGIKFGNLSYFILFVLAAGLALVRRERSAAAGVLLGLGAVVKPSLVLFGLFFLLRRDFKGLVGFLVAGVATAILSLMVYGWSDNLNWFETCIVRYSHGWLPTFSVQSISAFIFRLRDGIRIDHYDSLPQLPTSGENILEKVLIGLLFIAAVTAWVRSVRFPDKDNDTQSERRDLEYLLILCLALVSSPLAWVHYYCWLLMPAAFFLGRWRRWPRSPFTYGLGWLAIALTTPLIEHPASLGALSRTAFYQSFAVSHFLFGGLLWFVLIAWWLATSRDKRVHRL
ncbi:MAG: DUF2029 domain-containing protein [Rhizobiales bacterium]|nr:DUF2029 domain-containing protein [Hyphomicrobiales bacterium]